MGFTTHAEDFLAEGHKVRMQLQFHGRQGYYRHIRNLGTLWPPRSRPTS